jgi:hypothetical protein
MPPCLAPLGGFELWTGNSDYRKIEYSNTVKLTNQLPGTEKTAVKPSKAIIKT